MNRDMIIGVGIFFATIMVIETIYYALHLRIRPEAKRIRRHLKKISPAEEDPGKVELRRRRILSQIPWLDRLLQRFSPIRRLDTLLVGANSRYPLGFHLLLGGFFAASVFMSGALLVLNRPVVILAAFLAFVTPFLYLSLLKKRRMAKFQRQLPEALELVARALKAGHAFTAGMKMAADEFDDPVGTEFEKTIHEINFGVGIEDALKNLSRRVDCPDLNFFIISVIIQRETGGNLAEIIEKIGHLIRERFKLLGVIRTLSSEGRFSALVLVAIPFLVALYLHLRQPDYLALLFTDPLGKSMVVSAFFSMAIGIYVMRRMVRMKV